MSEHRGEQPDRAVQIAWCARGRSRCCSEWRFSTSTLRSRSNTTPARRPQRQRPLMVVLRHLLELRVLHDLQHPEAHRRGPRTRTVMTYCRTISRIADLAADLQRADAIVASNSTGAGRSVPQPCAARRLRAAARPAETPRRRRPHCRPPVRRPPHTASRNGADPSSTYSPMNTAACKHRRGKKHDEPRQRLRDDELRADDRPPGTRRSSSPARRCR